MLPNRQDYKNHTSYLGFMYKHFFLKNDPITINQKLITQLSTVII